MTPALLATIDQYIKGKLAGPQLKSFEEKLKKDTALREEVLLQQQLFNTLNDKGTEWLRLVDDPKNELQQEFKQKLKNPEYQTLSKKIRDIGQDYIQNPPLVKQSFKNRFKRFIPAAAAIAFLIIAGTIYSIRNNQSLDQYYEFYAHWETELPSFAEKGASKNDFVKAASLFKNKAYISTIQLFETMDKTDELYPYSLLYIGASYVNLNKDHQALETFNELAKMETFAESSRGLWYVTLIYLKQNNRKKATETLKLILKDPSNYRYKEANQLLQQLQKNKN